ncbi:MAG: sulfotransferase [Ilumatobacter sp.]
MTTPPLRLDESRSGLLVTGAHRSGSTWLGRLLAAADELHYVQEPYNIVAHTRWTPTRPERQFWYSRPGDGWTEQLDRVVELRPPLVASLRDIGVDQRRLRRLARLHVDAAKARRRSARPLMKDPIAVFSTPYLVERLGFVPVILVRDAVSFVGSLVARNWTFDFSHWIDQPQLMNDLLAGHRAAIEARPEDLVEQGIVEWNAIYDAVASFGAEHPDWLIVRYEDLAADPSTEIPQLFEQLGLRFGANQAAVLEELTTGPKGDGKTAIDVRRDSSEALSTWSQRLDDDQVERIRAGTSDVAERVSRVAGLR